MSTISIADASRQLSQIINRASYGREVVILTSRGRPKAVLLGVEAFQKILGLEGDMPPVPAQEIQRQFQQALAEAGYQSPEDVVELVRSVKREIADETFPKDETKAME